MELSKTCSFSISVRSINNINFFEPHHLGHLSDFDSSIWNICIARNYHIIINCTRSRRSIRNFAINLNISIYNARLELCLRTEHFVEAINGDQRSVSISLQRFANDVNKGTDELRGTITIDPFPCSSPQLFKKTEASNSSPNEFLSPLAENFKPSPKLSDDFNRLLNNPDSFSDATLKCGADEVLVHKCVLSVRSPVFAAMFKNQMQEGSCGVVDIVDIEPIVLQVMLEYVYSGKTEHLNDSIAGDVLFAADKYQLEELKRVCIDKLKSTVTVDNVFRILVLGNLHDESLKTHAIEFVCKCEKFSNLEKTEEWKLLLAERPGLAMEVLMSVVKYLEKFRPSVST